MAVSIHSLYYAQSNENSDNKDPKLVGNVAGPAGHCCYEVH